jgi:hypothetical protein
MHKDEILIILKQNYGSFTDYISVLSCENFLCQMQDKWTPGQQLRHLIQSVKPVRQITGLPKFLPVLIWGKANRKSRSYEELIYKYQEKLSGGGRAPSRFIPKKVTWDEKEILIQSLNNEVKKLIKNMKSFSEEDLDRIILPHPLLGKLTVREMLYFTSYHVLHHQTGIQKLLSDREQ